MPKGSDKTWVDKLITTHRPNTNFAPDRASATCFIVKVGLLTHTRTHARHQTMSGEIASTCAAQFGRDLWLVSRSSVS